MFLIGGRNEILSPDAKTGKELWKANLGGSIVMVRIGYELDGKELISVISGHTLVTFGRATTVNHLNSREDKMTTFTVHGNYGQVTAQISTGVVIKYEPEAEGLGEYADIIRFDVEEYAAAYPGENPDWIDICDIGFWTTAGEFEPPVSDFRAEIASNRL